MYNFWGHHSLKIWEDKNLPNLAHFGTTFDFNYEYLRNWSRYRQRDTNLIVSNLSCVGQKKFGELWFANKKI